MEKLLSITNLKKYFPVAKSSFFAKQMYVRANEDITLDIYKGETLGLVGESGCGCTNRLPAARCTTDGRWIPSRRSMCWTP